MELRELNGDSIGYRERCVYSDDETLRLDGRVNRIFLSFLSLFFLLDVQTLGTKSYPGLVVELLYSF